MEITLDYFKNELMKFRMEIMGSTKYTVEQKLSAFGGLVTEYARLKASDSEEELLKNVMKALKIEFDMRIEFELFGRL